MLSVSMKFISLGMGVLSLKTGNRCAARTMELMCTTDMILYPVSLWSGSKTHKPLSGSGSVKLLQNSWTSVHSNASPPSVNEKKSVEQCNIYSIYYSSTLILPDVRGEG